jgi:hypothetical protein
MIEEIKQIIQEMPYIINCDYTGSIYYAPKQNTSKLKDIDFIVEVDDNLKDINLFKNKLEDMIEYLKNIYSVYNNNEGIVVKYITHNDSFLNFYLQDFSSKIYVLSFTNYKYKIGIDIYFFPKNSDLKNINKIYYTEYNKNKINDWITENSDYTGSIII